MLGLLAVLASPVVVNAASIIDNGDIQLGVADFGQLNIAGGVASPVAGTTFVGLRDLSTGYEATSHGCLCEGWGVGIADAGGVGLSSGSANNAYGVSGLTLVSFTSTASTATSVVNMGSLLITHMFTPAVEDNNLYRVSVSITNTGSVDVADLRYTRTFDWDIEPTIFNEFVTIGGSAATAVLSAIDNGFVNSNPFASRTTLLGGTGDFTDLGPRDIGANFDFSFGSLLAGATFDFEIFYGATSSESTALNALNAVGAEVYSFGQASDNEFGRNGSTFIFGFAGVGGTVVPPSTIPVPAAGFLLIGALGMIAGVRARRKSA